MNELRAPAYLRCEYHVNPLGLDVMFPRLSWELDDDRRGARQTAYQLLVAADPAQLAHGVGDLWDSGKIESDQSVHVVYAGSPLTSRQRCCWQVRTWDAEGQPSPWSDTAFWEMGLLVRDDWQAEWIGAALVGAKWQGVPCPYLRKELALKLPVASARLYVTALGVFQVHLNGQLLGDDLFTPGWTAYQKRVQYLVYDVTAQLTPGMNALGAILGDGWYAGYVSNQGRQLWGDSPNMLAQLEITFEDGSTQVITTDASWNTAYGPLVQSDMQAGEDYDARLEMPGWDAPGFDEGAAWQPVQVFADPDITLSAMRGVPVKRIEELHPIADPIIYYGWPSNTWVFDMGQNMVGRVRLKITGDAGTTVRLRFAEILDEKGKLYTANLRSARATDHYTLRGGDEEIYEPTFTFHGFRYVEITGYPGKFTRDAVTGIVIHSDTTPTGSFACSDPQINQLQHNIIWGQKGNFLEVPTDCPRRDERLGWTGDAQVFIRTAAFNMDVAAFFTKWAMDVQDAQGAKGEIPFVVPSDNPNKDSDSGPAWSDAAIICPWTIYQCYGDTRLLEEHYPVFVRFLDYLALISKDYIRSYEGYQGFGGFGDWLSIKADTPNDLIGTAFYAYSAQLMAEIATALGKPDDADKYQQLFVKIRDAFQQRFVTREGLVSSGTQTAYLLALHFDLLPSELRATAGQQLVRDIERRGMHLSTGFVGSPYINHVLTSIGRNDIAYQLLHQTSWPSWLYAVTQGATTIWERWDGWTHDKGFQDPGMNSFNHYAYGAIGAWLYAVVAGIDIDALHPGYKHGIIHPQPGGNLTHARATLRTVYGVIESAWQLDDASFNLQITIPANTTATIYLPGDTATIMESGQPLSGSNELQIVEHGTTVTVVHVPAGRYSFTVPTPTIQ